MGEPGPVHGSSYRCCGWTSFAVCILHPFASSFRLLNMLHLRHVHPIHSAGPAVTRYARCSIHPHSTWPVFVSCSSSLAALLLLSLLQTVSTRSPLLSCWMGFCCPHLLSRHPSSCWLMITIGGPSPLWVTSSLGRWAWAV